MTASPGLPPPAPAPPPHGHLMCSGLPPTAPARPRPRPAHSPYLEWGHLMCSHSLRWASRFILRRGGQLGLLGQRTGL